METGNVEIVHKLLDTPNLIQSYSTFVVTAKDSRLALLASDRIGAMVETLGGDEASMNKNFRERSRF